MKVGLCAFIDLAQEICSAVSTQASSVIDAMKAIQDCMPQLLEVTKYLQHRVDFLIVSGAG